MNPISAARLGQYTLEIPIEAPRATVWQALSSEVDAWWPADFRMVGEGSVLSFDAQAGGQLVERKEGGGSLLWYTVQMCTPGESIHLVGHVAPEWGGPTTSMLKIALEEEEEGHTLVQLEDSLFGHVTEETMQSLQEGWTLLLGSGLKTYAESS